jgi:hypothetical protein
MRTFRATRRWGCSQQLPDLTIDKYFASCQGSSFYAFSLAILLSIYWYLLLDVTFFPSQHKTPLTPPSSSITPLSLYLRSSRTSANTPSRHPQVLSSIRDMLLAPCLRYPSPFNYLIFPLSTSCHISIIANLFRIL